MILDPAPGYVVKTLDVATGVKVFINVCTDGQIDPPATLSASEIAVQVAAGKDWIVPIVVSQGRQEADKAGKPSWAFDCCMNPAVLAVGVEDPSVKVLTVETCIELVEDSSGRVLSRDYKFPRMKAKGELSRTEFDPGAPRHADGDGSAAAASPIAGLVPEGGSGSAVGRDGVGPRRLDVQVVEESTPAVQFYFHVYRGPYTAGGARPSHAVEVPGHEPALRLVGSTVRHEPSGTVLDLKFVPSRYDAFYDASDDTTYVMLWK